MSEAAKFFGQRQAFVTSTLFGVLFVDVEKRRHVDVENEEVWRGKFGDLESLLAGCDRVRCEPSEGEGLV